MGNNKIIGAKIKSIRESKQLSTQEVSERSGLSIEQIERIEGNIDFPSIIRKTKCFDFWERNVLFPKTKRSFFRTPTLPFSA